MSQYFNHHPHQPILSPISTGTATTPTVTKSSTTCDLIRPQLTPSLASNRWVIKSNFKFMVGGLQNQLLPTPLHFCILAT